MEPKRHALADLSNVKVDRLKKPKLDVKHHFNIECKGLLENSCPTLSQYEPDVYHFLVHLALEQVVKNDFVSGIQTQVDFSPTITRMDRALSVAWIFDVIDTMRYQTEALFVAVSFMDRVISKTACRPENMKLLALTCLFIALKYIETENEMPKYSSFVTLNTLMENLENPNEYTFENVYEVESTILRQLDFRLTTATTQDFIRIFHLIPQITDKEKSLCSHLTQLVLLSYQFIFIPANKVAAAAVFLARVSILNPCPWTSQFSSVTGFTEEDLMKTVRLLHDLQSQFKKDSDLPQTIWTKYADSMNAIRSPIILEK